MSKFHPAIKTRNMASHTVDNTDKYFEEVISDIIDGSSIRQAIKGKFSAYAFYELLKDSQKAERYARATQIRADFMFDQIDEIADHTEEDHTPFTGGNVVQRDKLKIDAIKWKLAKMQPKKYGDKIDVTSDGAAIAAPVIKIGYKTSEEE